MPRLLTLSTSELEALIAPSSNSAISKSTHEHAMRVASYIPVLSSANLKRSNIGMPCRKLFIPLML